MVENVFVLGLGELFEPFVRRLCRQGGPRLRPLLTRDELMLGEVSLPTLLAKAHAQLDSFEGRIDGIVGFYDFPVTSMAPLLSARFGTRSPTLSSVLACEHKYWSRLKQQEVTEACPRFGLVDLKKDRGPPVGVRYPLWIKPVKAYRSELAFRVAGPEEFDAALTKIKQGIGRLGKAFDYVLTTVDCPPDIAEIGGQVCLAEEELTGVQVTAEGYCHDGHIEVYGLVDSIPYEGTSSFLRYQYPSRLPSDVADRLADIAARVVAELGLDNSTFNIEFFWDEKRDRVGLLEVNPRLSASHAPLFEYVDGESSLLHPIRLALGRSPRAPSGHGEYRVAAKWFVRRFADAVVRRRPSTAEIARAQDAVPGVRVVVAVETGARLSDLSGQDSYSYEVADVFVGANSESELVDKYEQCLRLLPFEYEE